MYENEFMRHRRSPSPTDLGGTECLPVRIIDLSLWRVRLTELKERAMQSSWEAGDNPYLQPDELQNRIKLYGRRIRAEMELLASDTTAKRWMPCEMPSGIL